MLRRAAHHVPLSSSRPSDAPPPAFSSPRHQAQHRIAQVDALDPRPVSPFLTDSYGRKHDYLRFSLTEKCNLRCTYCMPEQGVPLLPPDHLLTTDEVERVAKLFVQNGVTKIRLTGGEPTVRKDLVDVVARLGQLPLQSLGMTSNGIALKRKLPALVRAGLTHLNLSLDTLDEFKYELMTRRRGFHAVMEALEVAKGLKDEGLRTKINVVVIRGVNDGEVADFVELTKDSDITVRFIEYMPFEDNRWSSSKLVPSADLLSSLSTLHAARGPLLKLRDAASDTTRAYRVPGYQGSFGFISSMTDHFCGTCSRLRVAADGGVKVCLFGPPVLALRPLLRSLPASDPSSDPLLMEHLGAAVWGKKFAHDGLGGASGIKEKGRMGPMVGIGVSTASVSTRRASAPRPARLSAAYPPSRRPAVPLHLLGATTSSSLSSLRLFSTSTRRAFSSSPSRLDDDPSQRAPSRATPAAPFPADSSPPSALTHIDPLTGKAAMVSVSHKAATHRSATAVGYIKLNRRAWELIDFGSSSAAVGGEAEGGGAGGAGQPTMRTKKGDVLSIAQLAGLMGAKHTALLIPLCHPLSLSHISVRLLPLSTPSRPYCIRIEATAECVGPTGVEMEALTAASVAGLTVWDMCKAVAGEEMEMGGFRVVRKSGGRSGDWVRDEEGEEGA
ncbi:hypothetical protein JCM8097_002738 [Rhodosporidiobolus ruineniae]